MQIRLGFTKRGENDTFNDYIEERRASKIIFHKRFHEQSKMDNNIALIKLDQPVEFNDHIAPIGVFNGLRGFDAGNCSAIEAGWIKFGNRRVTGISGGVIHFVEPPMSDFHLRESLSRVFNSKECSVQLNSQINEKMLCAKSKLFEEPNVSTDFFRWNDGGPLVVQVGNMIQQIGIKSWAYEGQQYPTVYTRVDSYLDWIRDNLKM
jgi:trypsin